MAHQEIALDDVYDVWLTSFWQTPVGYAVLALLLLTLLGSAYALYAWLQARRGSTKERSLRALKSLALKWKNNQVDAKKAYEELTRVVKSYAQWRFGMPRGMTDYEFTSLLAGVSCDKKHCENLEKIIADAQSVKFGQSDVLKSHVQQDIEAVISFIEDTARSQTTEHA